MADIEWQGLQQAVVKLGQATDKQKQLVEASLKNNTEQMKAKAIAKAPVDTGFLKGQITTSYAPLEGTVIDGANYAGYQEYGTRFQSGTPHMRPAFEVQSKKFESDVKRIMKGLF